MTLGLLYNTAFAEKQQGLLHTAQAKRHVIESLLADIPARQQQTALQNLLRSYSDDHGDHNHEDILLVKNGAIQNVFLLDRPYRDLPRERPIPAGSALAEPVQLALTGHSGTLIKSDSWGSRALLVAYEPLPSLSMGLVMTMDMATIRRPFLQAGLIAAAIILLAAGLGSGLFVWATQPYVRSLRDSHSRFYRAVREAPFPTIIHAEDGNILHVNRVWSEITGYRRADIPTIDAWTERAYGQRSAAVKAEIDQLFDLQQRREDGEFTITTRAGMNVVWRFGSAPLGRLADGRSIMISSAVDVTSQRRIEQDLRDSEQRFRQLAENIDVVFYLRDIATAKMLYLSPAYEKIWGRSCAECYKNPFAYVEGVHPEDRPLVRAAIEEHNRGQATRLEYRLLRPDGAICHVLARSFPIKDNAGNVYRLAGIVEDITPLKTAGRAMQWAKIVFDSTLDGIMITDSEAKIIAINQAFSDITGYSEQQVLGRNANIVQSRRHNRTFYNTLWADLTSSGKWQGEIWNRRRNGEVFPAWLTISAVHDPTSGRLLSYVGTFSDISELKRSEEKIQYLAHHDALTGLPNRLLFHARLVHAMERARRNHQLVAVLFLDLDNFKNVNDSLGHPVGDALLKQVAERLRMSLRREDTVARLGGDEFVIALEELPDMEAVENMVNKIIATFADAFELDGRQTFVSTSIGVSTYPADGEDVTTLMKNADTALYRVKKESRNNYRIYSDDMSREATERLALELALRESIYEKTGFTLLYQPQIDLASGRIDGFEALLRWRHPQMGLVAPDRFIPLAEDTGLIEPISEWVLYSACRQLHSWHKAGFDELKVSVNLSGRDVSRREIARRVRQILSETGLRPDRLVLEITESSIMEKPEVAAAVLNDLTQLNVRFAVDDFGTGYSSLAYLKRFPLHTLKIDKVFVRDAPDDFNDTAICRAIIALAQSLNMNVVAEGIETEAQRLFLNQAGCELGQGYLFSHPLAAEAVGAYLKNTRAIDAAEMIVEPQTAAARNAS